MTWKSLRTPDLEDIHIIGSKYPKACRHFHDLFKKIADLQAVSLYICYFSIVKAHKIVAKMVRSTYPSAHTHPNHIQRALLNEGHWHYRLAGQFWCISGQAKLVCNYILRELIPDTLSPRAWFSDDFMCASCQCVDHILTLDFSLRSAAKWFDK